MKKLIFLLLLIANLPSHPQDEIFIRVYANTTMTDGRKAFVVLEEDFNEFVRLMKEAQAQLAAKQQEIDDLVRQRQALIEARDRDHMTKDALVAESVASAAERLGATISVQGFTAADREKVNQAVLSMIEKKLPTATSVALIMEPMATPTPAPLEKATPTYTPTPTKAPVKG